MAIKTDAMIAHNGADGYTLHIDYDPSSEEFAAKAVFNDGTEKSLSGEMGSDQLADNLLMRTVTNIESDVTSLGERALSGCRQLVTAVLPNATIAGQYAFSSCNALTTIIAPELESAELHCCDPCGVLETVYAPKIKEVRGYAFANCSKLKEMYMPALDGIYNNGFYKCTRLEHVYLGANTTQINASAFTDTKSGIVIDCGFASDSPLAADAPWGATNATVNYSVPAPDVPEPVYTLSAPNPNLIQSIDLEPLEEIQPVEPEPVEVKKTMKRRSK